MLVIKTVKTIDKVDQAMMNSLLKNVEFKKTWAGDKLVWAALVPAGFDIENTRQFMYLWTFSIKYVTIVGYTWDDYKKLLGMIKNALLLGTKTKIVKHRDGTEEEKHSAPYVLPVFIHNIKHEYSFMKYEFSFKNTFFLDKNQRNPMYLLDNDGFFYIDSYKLFPDSLENVAKAYCKTQKAVGDLDYSIDRNAEDAKHLSKEELNYCVCDTRILVELAQFVIDNHFLKYDRLPLTQNQMIKNIIKWSFKQMPKEEQEKTKSLLKSLTLSQDQYLFIRVDGGRGGHCASSEREIIGPVLYADESSAYAAQIIHGRYPMTKPRAPRIPVTTEKDVDFYLGKKCFQVKAKFYDLKCKNSKVLKYESRQKTTWCLPDGSYPKTREEFDIAKRSIKVNSSGKIWKAACIEVSLTDIDWEIYKLAYSWSKVEITRFETAEIGELPEFIRQVVIFLYGEKSKLKKAGDRGPLYQSIKKQLSNVFGAMLQRVDKDVVMGDEDEWLAKTFDSLLKPQWGVWVAANARKALVDTIVDIGSYWAYSDTDSIFADKNEHTLSVTDSYNQIMREKNKQLCDRYGLDYDLYDDLGCWDDDNKDIIHFKTLGPKAYMYLTRDGKYKFVMSGVNEKYFWEAYDKKYATINEKDVFNFFSKDTEIRYVRHKTIWVDTETTEVINGITMTSKSGCIIVDDEIVGTLSQVSEVIALEQVISDAQEDVM